MTSAEQIIYDEIRGLVMGWPDVEVSKVGRCMAVTVKTPAGITVDCHRVLAEIANVLDVHGFIPNVVVLP